MFNGSFGRGKLGVEFYSFDEWIILFAKAN